MCALHKNCALSPLKHTLLKIWLWSIKTTLTDKPHLLSRAKKKRFPEMFLFVWWMSCTYNGWALPLQINQTWHCPALEHLGRPRDRIKGSPRPWTLSVPNTHSKLENSYPAHFSHHHLYWLCLLVIGYFCLICSSRIPQCFRHGNWVQCS